jgi:hypothetical protein
VRKSFSWRRVAGRTDWAHGSGHVLAVECAHEFPTPKLRSSIGVDHASGEVGASSNGFGECGDREP